MNRTSAALPRLRGVVLLGAASLSATAHAEPPAADAFRFERPVTPAGPGPNRLDVDVPLLSGAEPGAGLRDLRFVAADGREVPYLLIEPRRTPVASWLDGPIVSIPATALESGFEVDLGRVALVDRVRVVGLPRPFLKRARLEGSGDRSHYTVLVPQATVFDLPEEQLEGVEVPFAASQERYLRVTWDNHATAPLPLPIAVEVRVVTSTTAPEPLPAEVPFERRPSRVGESRFRIRLPAPRLPLEALELSCGGGRLLRAARVVEPELRGSEVVPVERGHATLRRSTRDGMSASALRVPVEQVRGTEVDLTVDDGDNPPLDLQRVTAMLAPQPWIYLETPAGAHVVARYGNGKLAAPRYDLEAARADLDALHPARAAWGVPEPHAASPGVAEAPPADARVGASLDPAGFGLSRSILPGAHPSAGLAAVALDVAVLAHTRSFADLRIRDAGGHQVPYLLERRDEPVLVDLKLGKVDRDVPSGPRLEPRSTLYRIDLPFASLPAGRLVLATDTRLFRRHVTLLVARPAGASPRDPEVRTLEERDWTHADPETPAGALAMALGAVEASTVYLRVDEGDNAPLAVVSSRLELPGLRLRFFRPEGAALTLLYGDPKLAPPSYDLALLAPSLAGAVADELTLGPEAANTAAAPPPASGMGVFWGVLVAAVAILLGMMAMLLRKPGGGASPAA